jgi:hypothetical protein
MVETKRRIIIATVLSIGFSSWASGQGISPNASAVPQAQPQQQKNKQARVHGSPKELSIKRAAAKNQNQIQANAGNQSGNANVKPNTNKRSYEAALQKCVRERHDRAWWRQRYTVIVLVGGGYYFWDSGYWYPARGYDPSYDYYDYDGPIYTYGNLLPDQVIVNVQRALKQLGYYAGGLTGSLGPTTRQALANYQQDAGLEATGAIDAATVEALGLY